jgi:HAMP domain-containing protein
MKMTSKILRRIPLAPKLLMLTFLLGVVVWGVLDHMQTKRLQQLFEADLTRRLSGLTQDNRLRFDSYVAAYQQAARLIASQKSTIDYATFNIGSLRNGARMKRYSQTPPWLPDASVMRKFARIHYALLIGPDGRVREVYQGWPEPPPTSLLQPSTILRQLSHNQGFMTTLDGVPFLLTSESVKTPRGKPLATLLLATNLDDDFLISALGMTATDNIVALAAGDTPRIIASNRPELVPPGTALDSMKKNYLVTGKSFFDWGGSDLTVQLVSFISRAEADRLNASILSAERLQRAIVSFSLILAFAAITIWITRHIQRLNRTISVFSQNTLHIEPPQIRRRSDPPSRAAVREPYREIIKARNSSRGRQRNS